MTAVSSKDIRFLSWLKQHGAIFPKVDWPRSDTDSGIRGAIALDNISSEEHMITIPYQLMIAPPQILEHPTMGAALTENIDLLRGDFLLTVYVMHELRLGESSFYHPFLDILPDPYCIPEWPDHELLQLQDENLYLKAKNRQLYLRNAYRRIIGNLNRVEPTLFPLEEFTFDRFKFAWHTIQARAFGRRLPWTALVPFADCLNHGNVQTKYDFDIENNRLFRLFPSSSNHYDRGREVYNSYGRRANDNLLMDYGFAMPENMWEQLDVLLTLPREDLLYNRRRLALRQRGFSTAECIQLQYFALPMSAIEFMQIACCTELELARLEATQTKSVFANRSLLFQEVGGKEAVVRESDYYDDDDNMDADDGKEESNNTQDGKLFEPRQVVPAEWRVSQETQIAALQLLGAALMEALSFYETSIEQDEAILTTLQASQNENEEMISLSFLSGCNNEEEATIFRQAEASSKASRAEQDFIIELDSDNEEVGEKGKTNEQCRHGSAINAVTYRLTRKKVIKRGIDTTEHLRRALIAKMSSGVDETSGEYLQQLHMSLDDMNGAAQVIPAPQKLLFASYLRQILD